MSVEENGASSLETKTEAQPQPESPESVSGLPESGEIGNLMQHVDTVPTLAAGEIVPGTVLKVTDTEVIVDVGLKCEGVIARSEFAEISSELAVSPGDSINVWIEHYDEQEGTVVVSYRKAAHRRAWEEIGRAFHEQTPLRGRVVERVKGGLCVDIGVRAFLPGSHADLRSHFNLDSLLGREIGVKVIKLNRKRSNVVVSRRAVLEEELNRRKAELQDRLVEGAELVGRVKNLTDYGAFLDLGGIDGLLHITDLSWGRVAHPSEVVQVGQELRVKVLKYDPEKERVSLGLKQMAPDPWEDVGKRYRVGDRKTGTVVGIVDYGAFVELEPGVEGLIHISEMTWSKRLKHPSKILRLGDRVEVAILEANPAQRRISLSLRQTLPDPWASLAERYPAGTVVQGRVRNLTDFGAFVEVEEGVDGLIHLSNLTWTKSVRHPSEVVRKGQRVEAVVLHVDSANRRLSLGLKQLQPDIWQDFFERTRVGDVVRGRVARVASFGAFVELEEGIEGLCHISEIEVPRGRGRQSQLEAGRDYSFCVIRLNREEKKIGLSMKDVDQEEVPAAGTEDAEVPAPVEEGEPAATAAQESPTPAMESSAAAPAAEAEP